MTPNQSSLPLAAVATRDVLPLVPPSGGSTARPSVATEPPPRNNTTLRSILFWSHLVCALVVGLVVAIMSLTGTALMYEKQMLDWAATRHDVQPAAPGAVRLPLDSLYERVTLAQPDVRVTSVTLYADAANPVGFGLESRKSLFVDPYTARVLGDDASMRGVINPLLKWHRSLNMGEQVRSPVGVAITGASNLAFLFLIISGFILWFPRQWSSRAFSAVIKFNPRVSGRARDWNWHHVLGFWTAPILLLMVVTATFFSYRWPGELLEKYAGNGTPAAARGGTAAGGSGMGGARAGGEGGGRGGAAGGERGGRGGAAGGARAERPAAQAPLGGPSMTLASIGTSLDHLTRGAAEQASGWRTIQIRLPREAGGALSVTAAMTVQALPNERVALSLDKKTGALKPSVPTNGTGNAAKIRAWVRPVHTGEAGGIIGQTVAGLASFAAVVLFYTGLTLSWRRWRNRAARRVRALARQEVTA